MRSHPMLGTQKRYHTTHIILGVLLLPPPAPLISQQSLAMHRLAAAHKAVLGTLQNHFSACVSAGCGRPLPAELALLVERLVLLGTQLHIDAGEGGLLEDLKVCCTHSAKEIRAFCNITLFRP